MHPWAPAAPRLRLFELSAHAQQHVLPRVGCDELGADGQAVGAPVERERDGGLPAHVEGKGEGDEGRSAEKAVLGVAGGWSELAERGWWLGECRGEEEIEAVLPPLHHAPGKPVKVLCGPDVLQAGDRPALLRHGPDHRLDVPRADRSAGPLAPEGQVPRDPGRDDGHHGEARLFLVERGWMGLLHAVAERLEETCGHLSPADAFGVELHGTAGRAGEEAHPEPPGIRADLGAEWPRGGRGRVRVSRHVPRDHVEYLRSRAHNAHLAPQHV